MAKFPIGGIKGLAAGAQAGTVLSAVVDVAELGGIGATTAVPVINIPAGTFVHKVSVNVLSVDSGSSTRTFTVDDGAATNYVAAMTAKTVAHAIGAGTNAAGKFYAAASTIDLTTVQALADAVIEIKALCFAL